MHTGKETERACVWTSHPITSICPAAKESRTRLFCLERKLPLGEVSRLLFLLLRDSAGILLAQSPTDGTGLLSSQIQRKVFFVLVEKTQLSALLGIDDGENTGNGLSEIGARNLLALDKAEGKSLNSHLVQLGA